LAATPKPALVEQTHPVASTGRNPPIQYDSKAEAVARMGLTAIPILLVFAIWDLGCAQHTWLTATTNAPKTCRRLGAAFGKVVSEDSATNAALSTPSPGPSPSFGILRTRDVKGPRIGRNGRMNG
jgi:hypothetical protein